MSEPSEPATEVALLPAPHAVPPTIRDAMIAAGVERGTTMGDIVARMLAEGLPTLAEPYRDALRLELLGDMHASIRASESVLRGVGIAEEEAGFYRLAACSAAMARLRLADFTTGADGVAN